MEENKRIEELVKLAEKSLKCYVGTGDKPETTLKKIPTGIPSLDLILKGGLIRGRFHLIQGDFSTGKTYIAQKVIEQVQKQNGICVFIDGERRYDAVWFQLGGIDISKLIVIRPNYGEQAIKAIMIYVKEGVDLIAIDSLASLVPLEMIEKDEKNEEEGKVAKRVAVQARMFSEAFPKIISINNNTVIVATNQKRQIIGGVWGRGILEKMPGGEAQYYYASLIIDVRKRDWIKEGNKKVGYNMECLLKKCNFAPPETFVTIPFNFYTGQLDILSSLIDVAIDENIIKTKTAWLEYDNKNWHREELKNWFEENPGEVEKLREQIKF